jgi:hypothetical protein
MHFLLFSPVLLVSTLRFMTAYVTLGLLLSRTSLVQSRPKAGGQDRSPRKGEDSPSTGVNRSIFKLRGMS